MIVLLRVAALPTAAMQSFQCPSVLRHAREAEAIFSRLESRKHMRCDALHTLVPKQTPPNRRLLLKLKRAVYNHRPLNRSPSGQSIDGILAGGEGLAEDMHVWQSDVEKFHQTLIEGQAALGTDWGTVRQGLASVWQNELLQRGVLHARPTLHHGLDRYLSLLPLPQKPGWRDQKRELALLAYTYRASTKTSPFSTLTVTGVGQVDKNTSGFLVPDLSRCMSLVVLSPNLVARIARRWLTRADVGAKAPLAIPELLLVDGDQIAFLTRSENDHNSGSDGEVIRKLPDFPLAQLAVHLLKVSTRVHSLTSFKQLMANSLRCEESRLNAIVQSLRELGLVQPMLSYDGCSPNAIEGLVAATTALDCPDFKPERSLAESVINRLRAMIDTSPGKQASNLVATESDIRQLLSATEAMVPAGSVVFDQCALSETVPLPSRILRELTPVLKQLLNVLPLFNVDLGTAAVVQDFFRPRCAANGTLVILSSLMELWEHLREQNKTQDSDPLQRAADEHSATKRATADRRNLMAELRARMGATAGDVELPADFLDGWARCARSFLPCRARLSAAFLGQFATADDPETMRFILNGVAPGYSALAAGWARSAPGFSAGPWLRSRLIDSLRDLDPEGDVVEIATALDFGGQVRERLTEQFLSYPGSPYPAGARERIEWDDLCLRLDEKLDRVVLAYRENHRRVLPVHLGTISPRHFPAFYRFLLAFGPAFTPSFSVIDFVEDELSESERSMPRRYPRVVAGPVVLSRETWCIPSVRLPHFGHAAPTFFEFVQLRRWASMFDLPRKVFVTGAQSAEIVRDDLDLYALRLSRKPFYVDFDDYSSCVLFSRYTRRTGPTVRLVEAAPWGNANPFQDQQGPRAVELAIEVEGTCLP